MTVRELRSQDYRLDAQPLLDAMERRGGLEAALIRRGIPASIETDEGCVASLEYLRYRAVLIRAEKQGYINFWTADKFVVEVLASHPSEIFGNQYWEPITHVHDDEGVAA